MFLCQGQFFSGSTHRIYLLGNPVIWWSNLVFLALFVLASAATYVHGQRHPDAAPPAHDERSLSAARWLFGGWLLHYLPFWAMGRVLYFHHYFPALIFNSMLTGKRSGAPFIVFGSKNCACLSRNVCFT